LAQDWGGTGGYYYRAGVAWGSRMDFGCRSRIHEGGRGVFESLRKEGTFLLRSWEKKEKRGTIKYRGEANLCLF